MASTVSTPCLGQDGFTAADHDRADRLISFGVDVFIHGSGRDLEMQVKGQPRDGHTRSA